MSDVGFVLRALVFNLPRAIAMWVVELLSLIVVPIALVHADLNGHPPYLPRWAKWWDEPVYGTYGDEPWQLHHAPNGRSRTFLWRYLWLLRNCAVTFRTQVLGVELEPMNEWWVQPRYQLKLCDLLFANSTLGEGRLPRDQPTGQAVAGCMVYELWDEGLARNTRLGFYLIWKWPGIDRCIRAYVGWKFNEIWEKNSTSYPSIPFVYTVNLFTGWNK